MYPILLKQAAQGQACSPPQTPHVAGSAFPGWPLCLQVHEVLFINELQNQDRKLSLQRRLEVGWTAVHAGWAPSEQDMHVTFT